MTDMIYPTLLELCILRDKEVKLLCSRPIARLLSHKPEKGKKAG
jgi:hypothetical protein